MPFDGLFVPDALRVAVSDETWIQAMIEAERALARAEAHVGVISEAPALGAVILPDELARDARRVGNPAEPLVRLLRAESRYAHWGATSQDIVDTAAMLVARTARALVLRELDGVARECARLADEHRGTVMAGRTLLQQATPITFGLKAATWLVGVFESRRRLADVHLRAQLGGAAGTLAALGDKAVDVVHEFARELGLEEPALPWHATRTTMAELGGALDGAAAACAKIATDVILLAQTEVGEVREPHEGGSSTMPHKRNPVGSTLARACAIGAHAAAGVLTATPHEHERAAGAWQAEWKALSDALALTGGAADWMRETLAGLEVDAGRMRANLRPETLSEAERFGGAEKPDDYLGAADAFVDRALELYRQ